LPAFMAAIHRAMWSGSRQPRAEPRYEPDRGMELFVSLTWRGKELLLRR
jgi:hypothetical protein